MKKILLLIFTLLSPFIFGQTKDEVVKIQSLTDINKLVVLKSVYNKNNLFLQNTIDTFLINNPLFKFQYFNNGSKYQIIDIVNGKPVYQCTDNKLAALATKTNTIHSGGELGLNIEGQNMLIGVWDGGSVRKDHVEFLDDSPVPVSRVTTPDAFLTTSSEFHGTHVGGTLVAKGTNLDAKGMAPKASLLSYDWNNDETEVISQISERGLLLSNHSYGIPILNDEGEMNAPVWLMGNYDTSSKNWDDIAVASPYYLMVTSAGNSGADNYSGGVKDGFDKLTGEKNAKNNLVVANANPFVNAANGFIISLVINSSSSQGPSDDGRIKPDISGDGTNLLSTSNSNTTAYGTSTGTSMASPNVAGSLLLLQQYYNQLNSSYLRSSTLKGLVCHTARDGGNIGPDAKFGWGLLDVKKAAQLIQNDNLAESKALILEDELSQGETFTYEVNILSSQKLEATLSWIDPSGLAKDNIVNSPIAALVNDLDIRIKKLPTEVYFPWKLQLSDVSLAAIKGDNLVDNVEKVEVANALGQYVIEVTHKGNLSNSLQKFSLIISGFDQSLGNADYNKLNKISLYPNPANDLLNIVATDIMIEGYNIFDIQGRLIKEFNSSNSINQIDISSLETGVYLLKLKSEFGEVVKRFIKK